MTELTRTVVALERTRMTYRAPIITVFQQLAHWHALALRRQSEAKRENRRPKR